jgi:hypothetical protein
MGDAGGPQLMDDNQVTKWVAVRLFRWKEVVIF